MSIRPLLFASHRQKKVARLTAKTAGCERHARRRQLCVNQVKLPSERSLQGLQPLHPNCKTAILKQSSHLLNAKSKTLIIQTLKILFP